MHIIPIVIVVFLGSGMCESKPLGNKVETSVPVPESGSNDTASNNTAAAPNDSPPPVASLTPVPTPIYQVEERFVALGKGKQRILVQGDPSGIPVLLLHGATFRADIWRDLGTLQMLAENGFYAIAADLPGHGKTTRSGFSAERHLKNLIDILELNRPVVLGHSYAGAYIFPLIARFSETVRGAVLISPSKIRKYQKALTGKTLPVLILWGKKDDLIPVRFAKRLQTLFPNNKKVIFENAGHECYNHATDEFHKELRSFVRSMK